MHDRNLKEVFKELKTQEKGLSKQEAKKRLTKYGTNTLKEAEQTSPFVIFLEQFHSPVVYILIGALIISTILPFFEHTQQLTYKEFIDAIVIASILILNAILGFIQEYKAEKAIEALKKLGSLKADVIRDGKLQKIDAAKLVPGDIIQLEEGTKIPADARLIEVIELKTLEAALTGESTPSSKELTLVESKKGIADQHNMVFSGTSISAGRGKAIVIRTGMQTEIGKIAKLVQTTKKTQTPLQKKLDELGKFLGWLVIGIAVTVFISGLVRTEIEVIDLLLASIALAVAAIPEGLPAVVTISLALGVKRLIKKNALMRKLPSVETLGSTTVICSDKTGTLTCNQMTVKKIFCNNEIIDVLGEGYSPRGEFVIDNVEIDTKRLTRILEIGSLANNAELEGQIGDPTEIALIVSAAKAGLLKEKLEKQFPRKQELPFSSERKSMSTLHLKGTSKYVYTKGAPDVILNKCTKIEINGKITPLTDKQRKHILKANEDFAMQALRVIGFAYKQSAKLSETDLIFVGLQAMIDPARPQVKTAIAQCKTAGIRVIMITGDHATTAKAIAHDLGIQGNAMTGEQLDRVDNLDTVIETTNIFARVNPSHKTAIVDALRSMGNVIAMTGDGVNDAPALKNADIGIAMGITGTDVAKEAADMVLTDDNFNSIVHAIEEGRGIYANIKKFVSYLLSSNLGEVLTIFFAIILSGVFGNALPLLAVQILWINLVTDGLPALALSLEPVEEDTMNQKPRPKNDRILSRSLASRMALVGIVMMLGTLGLFKYELHQQQTIEVNDDEIGPWQFEGSYQDFYQAQQLTDNPQQDAITKRKREILFRYPQTMAFTVLMLFQMFNVINCRSEHHSAFKLKSNHWLWGAIVVSLALHSLVLYTPLASFFRTVPLSLQDWIFTLGVASLVFVIVEVNKLFKARKC
jgi:Ca2+-transporting ATPase